MRANVTRGILAYTEGSATTSVEAVARDQVLEEAEKDSVGLASDKDNLVQV